MFGIHQLIYQADVLVLSSGSAPAEVESSRERAAAVERPAPRIALAVLLATSLGDDLKRFSEVEERKLAAGAAVRDLRPDHRLPSPEGFEPPVR